MVCQERLFVCRITLAFPTRSASEQRRLLKPIIEKASWEAGKLDTRFRNPFEKLRVSNRVNPIKQGDNGDGGRK